MTTSLMIEAETWMFDADRPRPNVERPVTVARSADELLKTC
jgi:hypothetical protein